MNFCIWISICWCLNIEITKYYEQSLIIITHKTIFRNWKTLTKAFISGQRFLLNKYRLFTHKCTENNWNLSSILSTLSAKLNSLFLFKLSLKMLFNILEKHFCFKFQCKEPNLDGSLPHDCLLITFHLCKEIKDGFVSSFSSSYYTFYEKFPFGM